MALLASIGDALERIEAAVAPLRRRRRQLRVSTVETFASNWLLPRLASFRAAHPEIELSVSTSRRVVDFAAEDVDCAIRHGNGDWPQVSVRPLFRETLVPVTAPGTGSSEAPDWPIISARSRYGDWGEWWNGSGQPAAMPVPAIIVENRAQALAAADAGAGVALTDARYVSRRLISGELVQLGPVVTRAEGYYLVHSNRTRNPRYVAAFSDWLAAQVEILSI